ncbi:hypothetical protein [Nonomuraea typhae]|uniref:DUF4355 domain-containing protein n=1 Tax=Nonomuraea typhae TaxID=2603600 RepID=A0ABW7YJ15_9ACTN
MAPVAGQQYFTAEDVERFRAQEREKLYGRMAKQDELLEELRDKVSTFDQEREAARQAEEARNTAEADAARKAQEEGMSARQLLEAQRAEMEQRFAALQAEREQERATLEKEKQFASLQAFIQRRVREEQQDETIAPELLNLVDGDTEEAVEARIAQLRETTSAMVTNMQAAFGAQAPQAAPRGVSAAGYAATGPMDNQTTQRQITPEELRDMPLSEYAKIRDQLIGQAAQTNRGNGLFG